MNILCACYVFIYACAEGGCTPSPRSIYYNAYKRGPSGHRLFISALMLSSKVYTYVSACALHPGRLHEPATLAALYLLQRLQARIPAA